MSARLATVAAVTSCMVTTATGAFAWTFSRYIHTRALHYAAPLVVVSTVWLLVLAFSAAVLAELGSIWAARPPRRPGPTKPPEQPGETPRQPPSPIQTPRPHPPTRKVGQTETTLVDLTPVTDITAEIPRVRIRAPEHWRPRVSQSARPGSEDDS